MVQLATLSFLNQLILNWIDNLGRSLTSLFLVNLQTLLYKNCSCLSVAQEASEINEIRVKVLT
jgi:hypothetical protein